MQMEQDMSGENLTSPRAEVVERDGPWIKDRLRTVGLRPTKQRVALGSLLFGAGDRHISAEDLHLEATAASVPVSLATVYNTLHQFTDAGLLREVSVDSNRTYFDTNTHHHHHMFIEGENEVVDIPVDTVVLSDVPVVPDGYELVQVDVVMRVRPKTQA